MQPLSLSRRMQGAIVRVLLKLPAALLRILAGKPLVRDGQTLDVQTQLLLRLQRITGHGVIGGTEPERERLMMDAQCQLLAPRARGAVASHDIRLAGNDGDIGGRLYRPADCGTRAAALVFYHGGGFVVGSLDSHDGVCRALADRAGCVVIAVDYRLAPEYKAPAGVEDAIAAFRDIAARADAFDLDAKRLAVGGDSAGGNLAAVVAQHTRADAIAPCFQLLLYPTVDFARESESARTFARGFLLERSSMTWFRDHYIPDAIDNADARVSPIYGDLAGVAPALVVTGGFDPLRDEGEAYAQALKSANVSVAISREASMIHGFVNFAGAVYGADAALTASARKLKTGFSDVTRA